MSKPFIYFVICILLGTVSTSHAQVDAPQLRCIAVEDNGDITLTWIPPADPLGQFLNYYIFSSVNGTPFVQFGNAIPNRLQNTETLIGVGFPKPTLKNFRYYIVTEYNDGSTKLSVPSDTLTAIELDLTVAGNVSGTLNWNLMRTNPLPTWENKYNLKRKLETVPPAVPPIAWTDKFATPDYSTITFKDDVARCLSDISYQIELEDASGCISRSNLVKERLEDNVGAATMTYDRISVGNGRNNMYWSKHPDGSVVKYILIHIDPSGIAKPIDTVSSTTFFWYDQGHSAQNQRQCYVIAALDSCGKSNGGGVKHCTIYLNRTYDPCAGEVYLSWTPYEGWAGVDKYNIYMALDGDTNYTKIGTVSGSDTSYTVKNVNALNTYAFYIEGIDITGRFTSNSNVLGTKFDIPDRTKFLHIRGASVISEEEIELRILMDRKAPIKHVNVYRGVKREGPFKKVRSVTPPLSILDTLFTVRDISARPNQMNFVYYVEVIDTCNMPVKVSNKFRTIYLSGNSNKDQMENNLKWSANIYVDSSAQERDVYSLYRGINNDYTPDPIRTLWSNQLAYLDNISSEIHSGDKFCYRLKLTQAPSDTFEIADTSVSNEICFKMEPDVFIPNSFTPNEDGINEVWRPKTSYIIPFKNYSLKVFDRWGKLAFETTNPLEGWNGQRNDGEAPVGIYVYRLEIVTVYGSTIEHRGRFNLVR